MAWPALVLSSANAGDKVMRAFLIGLAAAGGLVPKPQKDKNEKRTSIEQWRDDMVATALMQQVAAFPVFDKVAELVINEAVSEFLPHEDEKARVRQYFPNVFFLRPINQLYHGKYASAAGTILGVPLTGYWAPLIDEKLKRKKQEEKQPR